MVSELAAQRPRWMTAKALSIAVPPAVLARADEVID
jgi:hypothetical protein